MLSTTLLRDWRVRSVDLRPFFEAMLSLQVKEDPQHFQGD
jgi:hypothetical protein